jgi:hypothetical protein
MSFFHRHASMFIYILVMLVIALGDWLTGIHFSFWALYFIPVGLAAWNLGFRHGCALAVLAMGFLLVEAFIVGHPYAGLRYLAWSYISKAIIYGVLVFLVSALRKKEVGRVWVTARFQQ